MGGIKAPQDYFLRRMKNYRFALYVSLSFLLASWAAFAIMETGALKWLR